MFLKIGTLEEVFLGWVLIFVNMNTNMNYHSSRTSILDSENFDYSNSRIQAIIIRPANEKIWNSCVIGYKYPTKDCRRGNNLNYSSHHLQRQLSATNSGCFPANFSALTNFPTIFPMPTISHQPVVLE